MKEKGIKNLIIDFGGVLIDLDRQRCIENFAKLGMPNVGSLSVNSTPRKMSSNSAGIFIIFSPFRRPIKGRPVLAVQI